MELLSVIVTIYNQEKYLHAFLDSLCGQTYSLLEIILVDDGSSDNSPDICDEYAKRDERIQVIHKANGGVASARNAGLEVAKGKYVFVLDGDDVLDKRFCEELSEAQRRNPQSFVFCIYKEFDDIRKRTVIREYRRTDEICYELKRNELADLINETFIHIPWNKIYLRDVIEKHHIRYDESVSNAEDYIFNMEYLLKWNPDKFVVWNRPLYWYRKHGTHTLSGRYYEDMFATKKKEIALLTLLEKQWDIVHGDGYYKRVLHCIETGIMNYLRPENPMPYWKKMSRCNTVMQGKTYKRCLKKCAKEMSGIRLFVCNTGNSFLFCQYIKFCNTWNNKM